jgi:hypothetical protein
MAREHGARIYVLRAGTSIAQPWAQEDERGEAYEQAARAGGRYAAGRMFWFIRNRLVGSYFALICASRS